MKSLPLFFSKYQAAGNDFILIDDRNHQFPILASYIQNLCDRHFGIGADGLILLQKEPFSDFWMRIFNSDGSEAEGCGNGLFCLLQFLQELGLTSSSYKIRMGKKKWVGWVEEETSFVVFGKSFPKIANFEGNNLHFAHTGAPHLVEFVENVEKGSFEEKGKMMRFHPRLMPIGTNYSVAQIENEGLILVRTFEKGVEKETLACGTAALATAYLAFSQYGLSFPITLSFPGGKLVAYNKQDELVLKGEAKKVFSGCVDCAKA